MNARLFTVVAALCLAACNPDPGPEQTTPAEFGVVSFYPAEITSETDVTVEVPVTSEYGFSRVDIIYMLNDDSSNVKTESTRYFPSREIMSFIYSGKIPRQKAGCKVTFQVRAITAYNVVSYSQILSYTVLKDGEEDDNRPEQTTPAEFGTMSFYPAEITSETDVMVEVPITSEYGFSRVDIVYMLDDDNSDVKVASPRVFPSAEITSFTYSGKIPKQKGGRKVTFQVRAITSYNVPSFSQSQSYTIPDEEDEKPEQPN